MLTLPLCAGADSGWSNQRIQSSPTLQISTQHGWISNHRALAVAFSVAAGSLRRAVEAACFSTWTAPCPAALERGREPSSTEPSGGHFICCTIVLFVCFCCCFYTPKQSFPSFHSSQFLSSTHTSSSSVSLQTLMGLPWVSASHGISSCTDISSSIRTE